MPPQRPAPAQAPGRDRPAAGAQPAPRTRPQPPWHEALQGLDMRELESPTVFDQFFGPEVVERR